MSHSELEDGLRSAYRARAELVTAADLTHQEPVLDEPVRVRHLGRRPWLPPLLAAAAVVLLAAVAVIVAHVANRGSTPPADNSLRFTTPHVQSWRGVGPGWTVAIWSRTPQNDRQTVFLVAPDGRRKAITTLTGLADVEFAGISQDNSHVALSASVGGPPMLVIVDLRTRMRHRFADDGHFVGFADPQGTLVRMETGDGRTRIVDDAGHTRSVRPSSAVDHALNTATGSRLPLTMNGQPVIVTSGRSIVIRTLAGRTLATLRMPGGGCLVIEPWDDSSLAVQCDSGMFAVPLDGSAPVTIAKPAPRVRVGQGTNLGRLPYRLYDVVRVAGHEYGVEVPSCGANDRIARVGDDLVARAVEEDGVAVSGAVSGHTDDAFYYVKMTGCQASGGTLYRYTPADHKIVALLGDAAHGGGVVRGGWTIEAPRPGGFRLAF
jgi:hypothetical protein